MTDLELFVKQYRPDLVSITEKNGEYVIGQLDGQDLPNLAEIENLITKYLATSSPEANLNKMIDLYFQKGQELISEFIKENLMLGITQAGKTSVVRKAMSEVFSALQTGALLDAIAELRAIPAESKDAVFITDARILGYINKIETFAGLPLSESV